LLSPLFEDADCAALYGWKIGEKALKDETFVLKKIKKYTTPNIAFLLE